MRPWRMVIERLYFLAKIERGLEQSDAGKTISHEDVEEAIPSGESRPLDSKSS